MRHSGAIAVVACAMLLVTAQRAEALPDPPRILVEGESDLVQAFRMVSPRVVRDTLHDPQALLRKVLEVDPVQVPVHRSIVYPWYVFSECGRLGHTRIWLTPQPFTPAMPKLTVRCR